MQKDGPLSSLRARVETTRAASWLDFSSASFRKTAAELSMRRRLRVALLSTDDSNARTMLWPAPLAALRHAIAPQHGVRRARGVVPHLRSLPSSSAPSTRVLARHVCGTSTRTCTPDSTRFLHSYRLAVALVLPVGALTLGAALGGSAPHKPVLDCASADRAYATAPARASPRAARERERLCKREPR